MTKLPQKVDHFPSEMASMETLLPKYYAEELSGLSPLTLKVRRTDLRKFIQFFQEMYGNLNARTWFPRDSRLFINELEKRDYAISYINRNIASIKSFGHWLWHNGYVGHNPVKGLREFDVELAPRGLEDRDWNRFQKAADTMIARPRSKYSQDFRNKVLALVLDGTGLRIEEVLSLKLEQFTASKFVNVKAKGARVRSSVPMKHDVADEVRQYIANHRTAGSSHLFTNRYGSRLSRNGIAQALNKIAAVASSAFSEPGKQIQVTPHRWRHRHGKKLFERTRDPLLVAKRLGHGSGVKYVGRYATPTDTEIEKAIEEI